MTTDNSVSIEVKGLKEIDAKLNKLGKSLNKYAQQGMIQASKDILKTEGLQKYPPTTDANRPPTPWYLRGVGTQYKNRNDGRSERYGTQWHTDKVSWGAKVGNRASYAIYVGGDKQPGHMAAKGWRKLVDVVKEKQPKIKSALDAWIKKAMKDAGLK